MALAGAVATSKARDGFTLLGDSVSYFALHTDGPFGGIDGLYLNAGFTEKVVNVPMGDPSLPSIGSHVPAKPRYETVQSRAYVNVASPGKVNDVERTDSDLRVFINAYAEAVAPSGDHEGTTQSSFKRGHFRCWLNQSTMSWRRRFLIVGRARFLKLWLPSV